MSHPACAEGLVNTEIPQSSRIYNSMQFDVIPRTLNGFKYFGGARGIMVIVVGNGHGDTSSNPGRD